MIKEKNNYLLDLKKLIKYSVCPLSKVSVAAIIVTDKGIFSGVNYENIVCSLSICAERNAIFNAITNGMKHIYEIHVLSSIEYLPMCGACRQLASSFSDKKTVVFLYSNKNKQRKSILLSNLIPLQPFLTKKG